MGRGKTHTPLDNVPCHVLGSDIEHGARQAGKEQARDGRDKIKTASNRSNRPAVHVPSSPRLLRSEYFLYRIRATEHGLYLVNHVIFIKLITPRILLTSFGKKLHGRGKLKDMK